MNFIQTLAVLLAAAVVAVPLTRRLGFGSILGYLVAGLAIGPAGLHLVTDVDVISQDSEFGVVMLLFLIGLEIRPTRLWLMRRSVLGLGGAQVLVTGGVLTLLAHLAGQAWHPAIVIGFGLAMSSTAIVLPMLGDRDLLSTRAGRDSFAVLLFQDMAFIPLVALVPLLGGGAHGMASAALWLSVGKAVAAIALVLLGGRYLIQPIFRIIARSGASEIFTATALLIVAGTAALVSAAGLSTSLGAFMAGVLVSGSEYRHELQADIEPFEGLLLGFFFMSVGMSADLGVLWAQPGLIAAAVAALVAAKVIVAFALARLARQGSRDAVRFGVSLAQGGEFAFVLFNAAVAAGVMSAGAVSVAMLVVAASMVMTPILFAIEERWVAPRLGQMKERAFDVLPDLSDPVIIAGFGRMGQIVGRILRLEKIGFTALERDAGQVDVARRFGYRVFYGDPSRPELLRSAGAETAKAIVVTLDNIEDSLKLVEVVRHQFPHLEIFARARNRRHAYQLMDRGVTRIVRETFHSSLVMSGDLLETLGVPHAEAERATELFRAHDERTLREQHAIYRDEQQLIQSTAAARDELISLFESDPVIAPASVAPASALRAGTRD